MADQVKWGIIGAGSIAGAFAGGIKGSNTGRLLAVGSRALKKAQKFAKANGAERAYGSYEELLADKDVEVVYVATPHPVHAEWAIGAAEAGKHVLSEKPAGLNYAEAAMMVEAAARNDVFFMEAFMYRCHPQIRKVADLVRDGAIGRVEWIDAAFGFDAGEGPEGRLFENDLGGGGILDVGCYAVSFSRLIAGVAQGREFADPIDVKAVGVLGQTGVDAYTSAVLKFEGDIIAEVQTAVSASMPCDARVYGSEGHIIIPKPWIPNGDGPGSTEIKLCKGEREKTIKVKTDRGLYSLEADEVAEHLDQRQASWPAMRWADTLGNMKTLDRWREEIGLTYEREKLENLTQPVSKRRLKVRSSNTIAPAAIPGVDREIARVIMGSAVVTEYRTLFSCYDEYFERGGNIFDTARVYGDAEQFLGKWIKGRGVRDEVMILGKGAHTPCCDPQHMSEELTYSLNELQTSYVDIYMLHRDNPEIPVGEFMDALNAEKDAGRMRAFGAANWTIERYEAANAYAREKGLTGFIGISNQFSVCDMLDEPWPGCLRSSSPEFRAWHEKTQTPLFAWASIAQGFQVAGLYRPEDRDANPFMARVWFSKENFAKRDRAIELAKKKGVSEVSVAIAYVLAQPFPVFALTGYEKPSEIREGLAALDISLTREEIAWLDRG